MLFAGLTLHFLVGLFDLVLPEVLQAPPHHLHAFLVERLGFWIPAFGTPLPSVRLLERRFGDGDDVLLHLGLHLPGRLIQLDIVVGCFFRGNLPQFGSFPLQEAGLQRLLDFDVGGIEMLFLVLRDGDQILLQRSLQNLADVVQGVHFLPDLLNFLANSACSR